MRQDSFNGSEFRDKRNHYGANAQKVTQLLAAGLVSTIAMLVLGILSLLAGLPGQDYAALYGAALSGEKIAGVTGGVWWAGLAWHFVTATIVFPLVYDFLIDKRALPNRPWLKGTLFGALIWALLELAVKPLTDAGFFSLHTGHAAANVAMDLVICLLYGVVLEAMTRVPIVHELRMGRKRTA